MGIMDNKKILIGLTFIIFLLSLTLVLGATKDLCTGDEGNNTWQLVIGKYFYCPGEDSKQYCSTLSPSKRTCTIIQEENLPQSTISNNYKLRIISSTYISSQIKYTFVPISPTEFRVDWVWKDSSVKDKLLLKDAEKDKELEYLDSLKTEKLIKTCVDYKKSDLCSGGTYTQFNETHYHCNTENNYKQCDSLTSTKKTCRLSKVDANCNEFSERVETDYFLNTKPEDLLVDLKELKKGLPVKTLDRIKVDEKNKTIITPSKIKLDKKTLDVSADSGSFIIDISGAYIGEKFKIGFATTTISITLPDNFKYINDQTPTFNFTVSGDYATYNATLKIDGVERGTSSVSNNTASSITCNTTLTSEGIYNWSIEAKWNATSVSNSTTMYFTLDVTDPVVTINYPLHNGRIRVFNPYINFTYSETYPEKVYFQLDGEPINYTTSPYLVDNHTVLYLKMNEGIGNQTFDESDYSNDGTIYGGENWTDGILGKGIYFDGVNDYVDCGNDSNLQLTEDTTWSFWKKSPSQNTAILTKTDYLHEFDIWQTYSTISIHQGNGTAFELISSTLNTNVDVWEHWCIIRHGSEKTITFYKNKVSETPINYSIDIETSSGSVTIGARGGNSFWFNGTIDEVRIFDIALSADEVEEEYYRGKKTHYVRLSDRGYPDIDNSTMLLMTFDQTGLTSGSANGTTERDISGNNNPGIVSGCNYSIGKFGGAMSFDGTDDYINCGHDNSLNITTAITLEAWVYPKDDGEGGYGRIMTKNDNSFILNMHNPLIEFTLKNSTGTSHKITSNSNSVPYNQWSYVIATYDGTTQSIYINGFLQTHTETWSDTIQSVSDNVYIGNRENLQRTFKGTIEQPTIYNRALSEEEIKIKYKLSNKVHNLTAHVEDLAGNRGEDTNKFSVDFASTSIDHVTLLAGGSVAMALIWYFRRRRK